MNAPFYLTSIMLASSAITATFNSFAYAQIAELAPRYEIAQAELGSFIDTKGRRVFYDLRTNKIVSVEETPAQRNSGARATPPPVPSGNRVAAPERINRQPLRRLREVLRNPQLAAPQVPDKPAPVIKPDQTETVAIVRPQSPAQISPAPKTSKVAELQILLDRLGVSPGVIDGRMGSNVRKGLTAIQIKTGDDYALHSDDSLDAELKRTGGPAFIDYVITDADVNGPYVAAIPVDYSEKAQLPAMSYTSPVEALAERFHMDEDYLRKLNQSANFYRVGTVIKVANIGAPVKGKVVRIEADKAATQVRAYDASGQLVVAYPATIGSADTPSPSGTVNVERIAVNPNYTYNPKINFTQGENKTILTIPPGPNGPVGSVWIALSKPTYGIHGTPDPSRIGKTNSHGCIRLTNWDAQELVKMVSKGVTVEFLD